ncbi:MAG TPA: L,D-transpeptidase [Solirubrobacteraceae bacterium]|jgi:lipoprotein-anchoring transpeptidase ErfK/SrfK|nr:L,D-transpeptidase [Solirubrobacteraceae bacterium]
MNATITSPLGLRGCSPAAVRSPRRLAWRLAVGLTAAALAGITASTATAAVATHVPATQQVAVLLSAHRAHSEPEAGSPQVALVPARRPITGEQTTLPVTGSLTGADGVRWLQVMLPGRPNSSMGWIARQGTRELVTRWHLVVNLAARRLVAYRDGRVQRTFQAVVGKPSTPTPTGQFFVEEALQMSRGEAGGPFALALSARSDALQEFEGGPGQIAIHGRNNLGGTLGSAASHGCIRLNTASIDWLAARIGPGTPVTIYGG